MMDGYINDVAGKGCIMYEAFLREFQGHNFVFRLRRLKPKNLKTFSLKTYVFPALV